MYIVVMKGWAAQRQVMKGRATFATSILKEGRQGWLRRSAAWRCPWRDQPGSMHRSSRTTEACSVHRQGSQAQRLMRSFWAWRSSAPPSSQQSQLWVISSIPMNRNQVLTLE